MKVRIFKAEPNSDSSLEKDILKIIVKNLYMR